MPYKKMRRKIQVSIGIRKIKKNTLERQKKNIFLYIQYNHNDAAGDSVT
jgi:hypothetical protein